MAATYTLVVVLSLATGIWAGEYCGSLNDYCSEGCCGNICCNDDSGLSDGSWVGIIIGAIILKAFFWIFCCYLIRRRRQGVIIQRIMVPQPQTTVHVNQSHVGYDQQPRPMTGAPPTNQPPMPPQYTQMGQVPPPPYEAPSALPPPK